MRSDKQCLDTTMKCPNDIAHLLHECHWNIAEVNDLPCNGAEERVRGSHAACAHHDAVALHEFNRSVSSCRGEGRRRWITLRSHALTPSLLIIPTEHAGRCWIVACSRACRSARCNCRSVARPSTSCPCVLFRSVTARWLVPRSRHLARFGQAACPAPRPRMPGTPR